MARQAYLILVDAPNESAPQKGNNKYYRMIDNGDGTFTAKYGRVGGGERAWTYSTALWDKKYQEKLREGYVDLTEFYATEKTEVNVDADDPLVQTLLNDLYKASHGRARQNYNVASFGAITQAMLANAQDIIDAIANWISLGTSVKPIKEYRDLFLKLYTVIPRRMDNVEDFLPNDYRAVQPLVESEQETLESLRGQVVVAGSGEKVSLLESMGIEIEPVQALPPDIVGPQLRWRRGFKVRHPKLDEKFQPFAKLQTKYLFHGSRKPNWLSILQAGLQIRPAANGTLYGNGIYFADDPDKSKRYTDGYMGVYKVAVGNMHESPHTNSRLSLSNITGDSVLGTHNSHYREYIIYRPEQCTIRYLLDVR